MRVAHGLVVKGYARPAFGGTSRRRSIMKNHQLSWWVPFSCGKSCFGQDIGDFSVLDGHAEAADVKDARFAGVNKPYNVRLFGEDDGSVRPQKLP